MEPRDAFQRPEVIAFCDARMLGAFVSTCRSAKTAARECDAWQAIARRMHERPAYFGGVPGSSEHLKFVEKLHCAPEYYGTEDGSSNHKVFMVSFLAKHSRHLYTLDGDTHNPIVGPNGWAEDIRLRDCRPLHTMTLLNDCPFLLLVGRRRLTVDDDDSNWLDPELDAETDGGDSSSDGSGDDDSDDGDDSEDGDSSMEAILAEAVQRLRT